MSEKIMGIYKIEHIDSGKVYIGSSVDCKNRFRQHKYNLGKNNHYNIYLQRLWNKYGKDTFSFSILEILDSIDILTDREQFWLDHYKSYERDKGFNLSKNAERPALGHTVSLEVRMIVSKTQSGKKLSDEHKRQISMVHKGKSISKETRQKMREAALRNSTLPYHKIRSKETLDKLSKALGKDWIVYSPNEKEPILIHSLGRFCKEQGLDSSSMSKVSKGKQSNYKGWLCRRYIKCGKE